MAAFDDDEDDEDDDEDEEVEDEDTEDEDDEDDEDDDEEIDDEEVDDQVDQDDEDDEDDEDEVEVADVSDHIGDVTFNDNWDGSGLQGIAGQRRSRIIVVPNWAVCLGTDGNEKLVLAYLDYWLGRQADGKVRTNVRRGGYDWVTQTYRNIGNVLGLTERKVEYAVKKLVTKGYIVAEPHRNYGKRRMHLRLRAHVVERAYDAVRDNLAGVADEVDR